MNPLGTFLPRACVRAFIFVALWSSAVAGELLPPGFRPVPPGAHALVGGRIVPRPGQTIESGTIVIRDGLIQAVGTNVAVPADARVWDLKGATIYAGFIEPYFVVGSNVSPVATGDTEPIDGNSFTAGGGLKFFGAPGSKTDMGNPGPGDTLAKIVPEFRALDKYSPSESTLTPLRELGFTAAVVAPGRGVIRGVSGLVSLADEDPNRVVLKANLFQHIAFDTRNDGDEAVYPGSLMGVIAAIRQRFFDAQHYALERADYARRPQGRRPVEFNPALEALAPAADKSMRVMFEPGSALMDDRAARVARELGLDFCLVSCGQEWRRPDLAAATRAPFIVPLNFPVLPDLPGDEDWDQISLDQLRNWDWAAENPALLRKQGLDIALTSYGLSDKKKFRSNLQLALDRGLSETDALAALTVMPARLCGVENRLGTIEPGKLAHLTVVEGTNYFDPKNKIREVWIDGRIYRAPGEEPKVAADKPSAGTEPAPTIKPKEEPERQAKPPELTTRETPSTTGTNGAEAKVTEEKKPEEKKNQDQLRDLRKTRVARSPLDGRGPIPLTLDSAGATNTSPPNILITGATIWTSGTNGILNNASLLISNGKVQQVGDVRVNLQASQSVTVDGRGLFVTPGIIDCHNHSFVLGGVNEMTLPSTAMVRIRDVVNSETDNLHQQLAGGVTAANVLHGSANPIGGQNCVIKLRDGSTPEELIFTNAPQGIKFALGENVKQSNWGDRNTTRFPQTRMGVRPFIENRFIAAREYLKEWEDYRRAMTNTAKAEQLSRVGSGRDSVRGPDAGLPSSAGAGETPALLLPRRDLELEAIGEILQGQRWIHCHGYRQDEMLSLLRLMQGFGVQIATFQHVLEGYKVADELAAGGVGGSSFSDWWAYKFEVYDAIPFNGSLMRERGMVVSFNSDSSDLARRLYLEAAKAVKYGGTPEVEALKFVTLNPAKQLRIDKYVGSLEPGKDGDFAVWSKSPLDSGTVCLQTWIEGRKYFDRAVDAERATRLKQERTDLIAKAKKIAKLAGGKGDSADNAEKKLFFQSSLEHEFDGIERHCMEEVR